MFDVLSPSVGRVLMDVVVRYVESDGASEVGAGLCLIALMVVVSRYNALIDMLGLRGCGG